jgi:hypothetical protein
VLSLLGGFKAGGSGMLSMEATKSRKHIKHTTYLSLTETSKQQMALD